MHYSYKTHGTCSTRIDFDLNEDGTVHNIRFTGGCNGNLKAVSLLSEGQSAEKLAALLRGNTCGMKPTSCADQFAKALSQAVADAAAQPTDHA